MSSIKYSYITQIVIYNIHLLLALIPAHPVPSSVTLPRPDNRAAAAPVPFFIDKRRYFF